MKVVLVDDHRMLREGIRWMLSSASEVEIVGEASDGEELLDLLTTCEPDIILLDIRMPGSSGIDALSGLSAMEGAAPPVLVLTMYDDPVLIQEAIALGAAGYILKSSGRDQLLDAMRTVVGGGSYLQGELTAPLIRRVGEGGAETSPLPAAEREVIRLVADGLANKEIAARLGTTESAVKATLKSAYRHLDVHSRSSAVAAAIRLGILD